MNAPKGTIRCYACALRDAKTGVDTAFLAGIAFAHEFKDDAMKQRLCPEHQERLVRGTLGARPSIPAGDHRS